MRLAQQPQPAWPFPTDLTDTLRKLVQAAEDR
jgi:hypothetical protein